jgi:hypothetical protein
MINNNNNIEEEEEEEEKNIEGRKERRHSLLYSLLHYNIYTG